MNDRITEDSITQGNSEPITPAAVSPAHPSHPEERLNPQPEPPGVTEKAVDTAPEQGEVVAELSDYYRTNPAQNYHPMKAVLEAQPKVQIMVPGNGTGEEWQYVGINGFHIEVRKDTYVPVPKQVAEIIMDSLGQTMAATRPFRIDTSPATQAALN